MKYLPNFHLEPALAFAKIGKVLPAKAYTDPAVSSNCLYILLTCNPASNKSI
jgi:hypothetical protein